MGLFNPATETLTIWTHWGNGADGDVVIAVDTVLTRDMFYNNLTVNAGVTLDSGGYQIVVKNKTINRGFIITFPDGLNPAVGFSVPPSGEGAPNTDDVGTNGFGSLTRGLGGNGGDGGQSTLHGRGNGAQQIVDGANGYIVAIALMFMRFIYDIIVVSDFGIVCGGGGGAGGGMNAGLQGGRGGAGGGWLNLISKVIDNIGGVIRANGANGGNALGANCGGGGGGGGGIVQVISTSIQNGTVQANGGLAGAKDGTGTIGAPGAAGKVIWFWTA